MLKILFFSLFTKIKWLPYKLLLLKLSPRIHCLKIPQSAFNLGLLSSKSVSFLIGSQLDAECRCRSEWQAEAMDSWACRQVSFVPVHSTEASFSFSHPEPSIYSGIPYCQPFLFPPLTLRAYCNHGTAKDHMLEVHWILRHSGMFNALLFLQQNSTLLRSSLFLFCFCLPRQGFSV